MSRAGDEVDAAARLRIMGAGVMNCLLLFLLLDEFPTLVLVDKCHHLF